jgi:hypothetical protein
VLIGDNGNVLWFGGWDDRNRDIHTGLSLNDRLIVQEGVTIIDGLVLDTTASEEDAFAMSDDGRCILFEGTLLGGIDGLFPARPVR